MICIDGNENQRRQVALDAASARQTAKSLQRRRERQLCALRQTSITWRKYLPGLQQYFSLEHGQVSILPPFCLPLSMNNCLRHKPDKIYDSIQFSRVAVVIESNKDRGYVGEICIVKKLDSPQNKAGLLNSNSLTKNDIEKNPIHNQLSSVIYRTVKFQALDKEKIKLQQLQHQSNRFILAILILTCFHNAQTSSGFSYPERNHNFGLASDDYPVQLYQPNLGQPSLISEQRTTQWTRLTRSSSANDDPLMGIMSTASGSFSQDPASNIGPTGQQNSWTSILNPLGLGQRPPQTQQNTGGGGGGGDELDNHIKKILVPRVSGTPGNVQVREYIVNELKKNDYHVELDEFTASTPVGKVKFANIIASSNPNACRQLVLACHYDSKMMDGFLGAIDSAVPCAMLLMISNTFSNSFRPISDTSSNSDSLGLQFIFFDGEEAYVQWSSTDSLYGSRNLAAKWEKQPAPIRCGAGKKELDRIELFVLLDLIGASDTSFVMYNTRLRHHYEAMQKYEKSFLARNGLNQLQTRRALAFKSRTMPLDFVEDDHVPFRKRGVPILLLLANPFPRVWHTVADNYDAIDFPKTRRILHVMEEFVANYSSSGSGSVNT